MPSGHDSSVVIRETKPFRENWDDDRYQERELVIVIGRLRSQSRRKKGPRACRR